MAAMKQILLMIAVVALGGCGEPKGASALRGLSKMKRKALEIKCRSNLKHIAMSTIDWAEENNKDITDKVSWDDILRDFDGSIPVCKAGGKYTLTTIQEAPTCSVEGHSMDKDTREWLYSKDKLKGIRDNHLRSRGKK